MTWEHGEGAVHARRAYQFRFRLENDRGGAPADMELYMGMLGHAAFVKTDGTVFAHVHPTGTVAMAAYMMANPTAHSGTGSDMMNMPGMNNPQGGVPNTVSFPYGFPTPGQYRIFVQMKHGSVVETGAFDAVVKGPPA